MLSPLHDEVAADASCARVSSAERNGKRKHQNNLSSAESESKTKNYYLIADL